MLTWQKVWAFLRLGHFGERHLFDKHRGHVDEHPFRGRSRSCGVTVQSECFAVLAEGPAFMAQAWGLRNLSQHAMTGVQLRAVVDSCISLASWPAVDDQLLYVLKIMAHTCGNRHIHSSLRE